MKVRDIITESIYEDAKDEKRLDVIADELASAIHRDARLRLQQVRRGEKKIPRKQINLGRIREIVDSKTLSRLYGRLGMLKFIYKFTPVKDFDAGKWGAHIHWEDKYIQIDYPYDPDNPRPFPPRRMHTSIVHELRHALDYSLSKGHAIRNTPAKGSVKSDDPRDEYLRQPHEINARVSQAMLAARDKLIMDVNSGKKPDIDKTIRTALKFNRLDHLFGDDPNSNKAFRKIYNRMYKYLQDFLEDWNKKDS